MSDDHRVQPFRRAGGDPSQQPDEADARAQWSQAGSDDRAVRRSQARRLIQRRPLLKALGASAGLLVVSGGDLRAVLLAETVALAQTSEPITEAITTLPIVTEAMTTLPITTEASTTEAITTEAITTEAITTEAITTEAITTEAITTLPITTEASTTEAITTLPITTEASTTEAITTLPVTTEAITTQPPSTTEAITTQPPITTEAITTLPPSTTKAITTLPITTIATTTKRNNDDDDDDKKRKRSSNSSDYTNTSGDDDHRTEGQVKSVNYNAAPPTITLFGSPDDIVLELSGDALNSNVRVGDYIVAYGEKVNEGLYQIDRIQR